MNLKWLGGAGLISGTAIGATVLALIDVVTGLSLLQVLILYSLGWLTMMLSGLMLAEICQSMPLGQSFLSISEHYWGRAGKWLVSVLTAVLIFFLLCAYYQFLGGLTADFVAHYANVSVTPQQAILAFGGLIFCGLLFNHCYLDMFNRMLIVLMIASFLGLFYFTWQELRVEGLLMQKSLKAISIPSFLLVINAFGYHIVIPSIRSLLGDENKKDIYKSVMLGSFIPLVLYLLWYFWIMMLFEPSWSVDIVKQLAADIKKHSLSIMILDYLKISPETNTYVHLSFFNMHFSFILTSLIGISLSFYDLIKDFFMRYRIAFKCDWSVIGVCSVLPIIVYTLYDSDGYVIVLQRAGLMVLFLNIYLPALFVLQKRLINKDLQAAPRFLPSWFVCVYLLLITAGLFYEFFHKGL